MAKVFLTTSPPDTEIAIALSRVDRLLTTKRGRDPIALSRLSSCRAKLLGAAADLKLFNQAEAARCRATAPPPAPAKGKSNEPNARGNTGAVVPPRQAMRIVPQEGGQVGGGADENQTAAGAVQGGEGTHDDAL
jgi:hypothetical protein